MAKIVFSPKARADLVSIRSYIRDELENPDAARRIMAMLKEKISVLSEMPEIGQSLDAILPIHTEYRFLVCEEYLAFYLYDGETIEIIRILHHRQDYLQALLKR